MKNSIGTETDMMQELVNLSNVEDSDAAAESDESTLAEVMKMWEWSKISGNIPGRKIAGKSLLKHTCWDTLRIIIEYMQLPARERPVDVVVHKASVSGELDVDGPIRLLKFSCLPYNPLSYLKLLVAEQLHPDRSSLLDRVHEFNTLTLVTGGRKLEDWTELSGIDSFAKNPFFHCYLKFTKQAVEEGVEVAVEEAVQEFA